MHDIYPALRRFREPFLWMFKIETSSGSADPPVIPAVDR